MKENGIFSGLLYCADCKHSMLRKYARRQNGGFIGYICKTYKTQGKKFCASHSIDIDILEETVLHSIQCEAQKILSPTDIDELGKLNVCREKQTYYEMQAENMQKRLNKLEKFKRKTYDNYMEDLISREEYVKYTSEYESEIKELQAKQEKIQNKSDIQQELNAQYDEWTEAFRNYIHIEKLTREVVLELIDKIEIEADNSITIYYKFHNPYAD